MRSPSSYRAYLPKVLTIRRKGNLSFRSNFERGLNKVRVYEQTVKGRVALSLVSLNYKARNGRKRREMEVKKGGQIARENSLSVVQKVKNLSNQRDFVVE